MSNVRPGILALRAVNQYRRRDVVAYLGLRYYLDNSAARLDQWAQDVATSVLVNRSGPSYFESQHFKEFGDDGKPVHRVLYVPPPNEAFAETSLLADCAAKPEVFKNPKCVFSYELAEGHYKSGAYLNYMSGIRRRHAAISAACEASEKSRVRFIDIRRFYPSIRTGLAESAWRKYSSEAGLAPASIGIGGKLLTDYAAVTIGDEPRLPTGPMFSHLLANLVLRDIDAEFSEQREVTYVRYVDDMTLIGPQKKVDQVVSRLSDKLEELGLTLHDESSEKSINVSAATWLEGRNDFAPIPKKLSWLSFVRDLKQFLVSHPNDRNELAMRLQQNGFRVPVRDYSQISRDAGYLGWFKKMLSQRWFKAKAQRLSLDDLLARAQQLRMNYEQEFSKLLDQARPLEGYTRKRLVPKLRMRAAGLVYFASAEALEHFAADASEMPELAFYSRVMHAVATGDVTAVLGMGTNVAQAVAQALRASGTDAFATLKWYEATKAQSVGILALNGVKVRTPNVESSPSGEFVEFASKGATPSLMRSKDGFIREVACLHGLCDSPRHTTLLDTAFDEDEDTALDAFTLLQGSIS